MVILVFLFLFAATSFVSVALPGAGAHAQERRAGEVYRIGFLRAGPPLETYVEGLWQGLRELGYVDGQNVVLEFRTTDGSFDQLPRFAEELLESPFFTTHRARLAELAARSRVPAIYGQREYVAAGGLMSYGTDFQDLFRRAAPYVDKILKGAKPADLPVEQPTKFDFVINLRTSRALGLTIPPSVQLRADQVIE